MTRTQSPDTDRQIEQQLFARYRAMTPSEKMSHVSALGRLAESVAMAGLRSRYPAATEEENRLRLASRWIDRETMIRLYDWDPEIRGR